MVDRRFPVLLTVFTLIACSAAITLIACAGGGEPPEAAEPITEEEYEALGETGDLPPEIAGLLELYEEAIRTTNPELLAEVMHPDTSIGFTEGSGQRIDIHGFDAVTEFRLAFFRELGPPEEYRLGEIEAAGGEGDFYEVVTIHPEIGVVELFHFGIVDDRWALIHLGIELPLPGEWVSNRYQATGDHDENGFLDGEEREELFHVTRGLLEGSHDVRTPVGDFFDRNHDGVVDEREIDWAREVVFLRGLGFYFTFLPEAALEFGGEGPLEEGEIREIFVENPDMDHLIEWVTGIVFPDAVYQEVPREVSNLLDELADGNGDRVIDEMEQGMIFESLAPAYHPARTFLDFAIDRNGNEQVEAHEILLVLQASAMGRGVAGEGAEPPYSARTPVDVLFDRNRDGDVDAEEIEIAVLMLAGHVDAFNMISEDLRDLLDVDGDGRIDPWEVEEAKGLVLFPRPVDPAEPLDNESDVNGDGFIDPEELGISAGVTNKGVVPPFEERIEIMRRRSEAMEFERAERDPSGGSIDDRPPADGTAAATAALGSEYYRKLGTIQDKKLAVVSLDIGTEKVNEETAKGVVVFVENAFVNVGKVKVVDRSHIEEIFDEYAFQASGVIDESTAVEIGKLSGADIIVIGSIHRVGEIFYLNIKLLAVETAEIIGSSISQAENASGFLDMANQAVYKLF